MPVTWPAKTWHNDPASGVSPTGTDTPLSAAGLNDLESRLTTAFGSAGTGSGGSGVGATSPVEIQRKTWMPTGLLDVDTSAAGDAFACTLPDRINGTGSGVVTSGTVRVFGGITVPAGRTVDSITFLSGGTAGAGLTNTTFFLVRQSDRVILARSRDETTTTWAANTARTLKMTSAWTATADTPVYVGLLCVGTTMPNLSAVSTQAATESLTPNTNGTSTTGQTTGAAVASPIAALTGTSNRAIAFVNSLTAAPASDVSEGLLVTKALGSFATDGTMYIIGTAMFPMKLQALALTQTGSNTASDTNYWTLQLGKIPALSSTFGSIVAQRSTQATGGSSWFQFQAFTFDAATWDATNSVFTKDDVIAVKGVKTGAPTNITSVDATLRYQVL